MRTISGHFRRLIESEYRKLAFENAKEQNVDMKDRVETRADALAVSFCWERTPQGHGFWSKIWHNEREHEQWLVQ